MAASLEKITQGWIPEPVAGLTKESWILAMMV